MILNTEPLKDLSRDLEEAHLLGGIEMSYEEMIAVIQAHKEGMQIQISLRNSKKWEDCMGKPDWDFRHFDYRVKPEPPKPKYRPYANEDECFKDACKHGIWLKGIDETTRGYHNVFSIMPNGVKTFPIYPTYEKMLKIYVWADDGSPCGILEE